MGTLAANAWWEKQDKIGTPITTITTWFIHVNATVQMTTSLVSCSFVQTSRLSFLSTTKVVR
jgi:hypothetical protein